MITKGDVANLINQLEETSRKLAQAAITNTVENGEKLDTIFLNRIIKDATEKGSLEGIIGHKEILRNQSKTALVLGSTRDTVRTKMKRHGFL